MKTYNRTNSIIFYTAFLMGWVFIYASPASQVLARGTQVLTMETIAQEGQKYMENTLPWDPDRIQIKVVYEGKSLLLPKGHLTLDYKLPGQKKRVGRVPFIGFVKVDGIIKKRLRLVANVTVAYDVFRSVRSLKRGHVIQHQDVELIRVESNKLMRNIISDESDLIGHRLVRNLGQRESFLNYMVRKIPLVKTGDRILIVAQKGPLRVTAPGVVKENGFKNDTVRVENINSRKLIFGTVVDSHTIRVNY